MKQCSFVGAIFHQFQEIGLMLRGVIIQLDNDITLIGFNFYSCHIIIVVGSRLATKENTSQGR